MRGPLRQVGQDFPGATHLLFGFGERAYWTRPDPSFADMLLAFDKVKQLDYPARGEYAGAV